jgi:RNA polymerase-binding transcription factor DksA
MKRAPNAIPSKWAWHHRTLLRLRAELLKARQEHDHAARVPHERGGADALDVAEDEVELNTLRAELALEDFELSEIEAALKRLQDGKYGVCEITGKPIATDRLRALPWTRLSKTAAAGLEVAGGARRRK